MEKYVVPMTPDASVSWEEIECPELGGSLWATPDCDQLVLDALQGVVAARRDDVIYRPGQLIGASQRGSTVYALPALWAAVKLSPVSDATSLSERVDDIKAGIALAEGLAAMARDEAEPDGIVYTAPVHHAAYVPNPDMEGNLSFTVQAMSRESGWPSDWLPKTIQKNIPTPDERAQVYQRALSMYGEQRSGSEHASTLSSPVGREVVRPTENGFAIVRLGVHIARIIQE